jgi:rare lipoprotein A
MLAKRSWMVLFLLMGYVVVLSGCKGRPSHCSNSYDHNYQGSVKVGDSYDIKNKTYEPKLEHDYDEVGIASWYGDQFHCSKTANGEYFNKHQFSAAHNTLPLPSVAKVTNLSNNRSINVIINDRGPFSKERIIDISESTAVALGMKAQGIAKVRVQFLPKETNELMNKIASRKKIYYKDHHGYKHGLKFEIIVEEYKDQKIALTTIRKLSKLSKIHLLMGESSGHKIYRVILPAANRAKAKSLLNKVTKMGYKHAKINSH